MTEKAKALDVTIMGRSYKVTCADEEREALLQAVSYLDQKMGEIKSSGRVASVERIAVMAALNIAHEMLEARTRGATGASAPAAPANADGFDIAEARRRMAAMQAALDQALAPQEKLL
jgi:cell division protein ZapA